MASLQFQWGFSFCFVFLKKTDQSVPSKICVSINKSVYLQRGEKVFSQPTIVLPLEEMREAYNFSKSGSNCEKLFIYICVQIKIMIK